MSTSVDSISRAVRPCEYLYIGVAMGKEERFDLPEYNGGLLNLTATSGLLSLEWARDIAREPATVPVLTAGALVSSDSELPPDHLVRRANYYENTEASARSASAFS